MKRSKESSRKKPRSESVNRLRKRRKSAKRLSKRLRESINVSMRKSPILLNSNLTVALMGVERNKLQTTF